jgi:chromosome segregation ATPase
MANDDIVKKIVKLKESVVAANRLRATAEANLQVAKRQLQETEQALRDLGVDPDRTEEQLQTMEAALHVQVDALTLALDEEIRAYNAIIAATKPA